MSSKKSVNTCKPPRNLGLTRLLRTAKQSVRPLFVTLKVRKAIERLLPVEHHQRLHQYFETYGCLHCSRNSVMYGANGFCMQCINMLGKRMRKVDKELRARKSVTQPQPEEAYLRSYNSARHLLADLARTSKRPIRGRLGPKSPSKVYIKL
jgi:hypothetical protein